jgi:ribonucleoside-diphosphate reductase alpha chain
MQVVKRNGLSEAVSLDKILSSLTKTCKGLDNVDVIQIATKTIGGLYDGVKTTDIDALSFQIALENIPLDPENSKAAARILLNVIYKEVELLEVQSFSQSIKLGHTLGLISDVTLEFVQKNTRKLNAAVKANMANDKLYEAFGLKTMYDRYLQRHPENRKVFETPQYMLMRVACGLFPDSASDAVEFYETLSSHLYMTSTPTLFNSATLHTQMSSCYLLDSPKDDLADIYKRYSDIAMLSKFAGGIGVDYSYVRAEGALIKGTNGLSNGIVPFLHTLDRSVVAVNQGGKRKGAACVYLESFHADIEAFNELRKNTGDEYKRTHNLNIANWVPDLLMERSEAKANWTLFSPDWVAPSGRKVSELHDLYGDEFKVHYEALEAEIEALDAKPRWYKNVPAQTIFGKMVTSLCETGNGWINFKDHCNSKSNQVRKDTKNRLHLSNLCTEILEVVDTENTAVCNLGSVNIGKFVKPNGKIDWNLLKKVVRIAVTGLDRVVDINFYPIPEAKHSNHAWRPVGLGLMGWQDLLFKLRLPFDSARALELAAEVQAFIYYHAMKTSIDLAKKFGPFEKFAESRTAHGEFQFDMWGVTPVEFEGMNWEELRAELKQHGVRNSLLIAIAPTATIASIVGAYECIEPHVSNLFKRETLSGEFLQVNDYLVAELKALGLWTPAMYEKIKAGEGSIQNIYEIPEDIRILFRTAWELSQKSLIDAAVSRGPYICQSQSLNLFLENPTIGKASSMYMYAWKKKAKTTYYLRSRGATRIAKLADKPVADKPTVEEVIACSLENPESCAMCT